MFISVDLPEPDGPMIATSSFAPMLRSTPRRAWTVSAAIRYSRVIPWRRMIASTAVVTGQPPIPVIVFQITMPEIASPPATSTPVSAATEPDAGTNRPVSIALRLLA